MHARAHTSRKRARAHLRFVIEGKMQQFEPFQPGFWDSQDFNWILYDWTHIPLPNVHMNQPSSLFSNFEIIFFSSIMSVNFYKYCHIILRIWSCILRIGMSVRRSSRSAFGWSTGNDVSGHYKHHYFLFFFFFFLRRLLFS